MWKGIDESCRYRTLLGVLFGVILIGPVISEMFEIDVVPFALTLIVLVAYRAVDCQLAGMALAVVLASLVSVWACSLFPSNPFQGFQFLLVSILLLFVCSFVGTYLSRANKVDQEVLAGSVCGYLLFGISCGGIYAALDAWAPGGVAFAELNRDANLFDFVYFSFVVLTTIGFGDVVPVNAVSRSVAMIEGIVGLFYVAIVVSRLVSLFHRNGLDDVSD
jgi:voltage-gated potassium channel